MDDSLNQGAAVGRGDFIALEPRRALAAALAWSRARAHALACAALLSVMSLQMLAVVWQKSITVDEVVMIPAAYYHLAAGNCQLVHEHPPLAKILAGVPLLFLQPDETDPSKLGQAPDSALGKWTYEERFWEGNPRLFESISFWARVPMIALSALTGLLLFAFARDLFGARAAVFAIALYSVEPTILAHGRVVQTDVPAAFGYLLLFYALYRYLRAPSAKRAVLLGAAGGVACLAKFSMLLAAPVLGAVFLALCVRALRRDDGSYTTPAAHACAAALAALLVINAAYFFDHRPLGFEGVKWLHEGAPQNPALVVRAVEAASFVLPTDFVLGILWQIWHNRDGHSAALLGMYSRTGWWYYFPVAFALKTTLPFLLLSLASLAWGARRLLRARDVRFLLPLSAFAVYTAFVLLSRIDIGVRYYLPAYIFLFMLGGALLERLWRWRRRAGVLAVAALLGWMCFEAARAYPDHMTYMNQLASGAPHWWYLSDSNVEWGDDVRSMAEYLRARGETRVRAMTLGGFLTLHHYGVDYLDALAVPPGPPPLYTAIGASFLNGSTVQEYVRDGRPVTDEERVNTFDEYRRRTPEKIFGGSIYLFREDGR